MYKEPQLKTETISQALFGERVNLLEEKGVLSRIETVLDGYQGWIEQAALYASSAPFSSTAMVNRPAAHLYDNRRDHLWTGSYSAL